MEELMRRAVQNKFNPSYRTEYRAVSIELGVGERTLLRYRKQFVRSFVYMLDSLKQEESLQEAR